MKKAVFITHPNAKGTHHRYSWGCRIHDNYSFVLGRGEGLLTLMGHFSPDRTRNLERITLRASALGIFDVFINGMRVGHETDGGTVYDEYKPGWTDYRLRVFEYEYDITALCAEKNRITAEVSPGWWSGRIAYNFYGSKACAFAAEIEISYRDGSCDLLSTDESWLSSICGPVMRADIWDGEYYDATVPEPSMHPEAHSWVSAIRFDGFEGEIVPLDGPPVRSRADLTLRPRSAIKRRGSLDNGTTYGRINILEKRLGDGCECCTVKKGESLILDMGENFVGRPQLRLSSPRGTETSIIFSEMLNDSGEESRGNDGPEGSLYLKNYRAAYSRLVYIASGNGQELYFPTHSFFGYRYLEITPDADTEILAVLGEVIGSSLTETGSFFCSNEEVNRFYSNVVRSMRSNYFSIPTDCPQRDERIGWTGDAQVFAGAASYLADIRAFMRKWLCDLSHSQVGHGGAYCSVAPRVFAEHEGAAAWADAGLIIPYRLYKMYGDISVVEENFASMEAYMEYLTQYGLDGPRATYGDHLAFEATDKRYISVSYYANDAAIMEYFCTVTGREERAAHYHALHLRIVEHWRNQYIKNGELSVDTQTGCILALAFKLAPSSLRPNLARRLEEKIVSNGYRLSTGFVGTSLLCNTLSEVGLDGLCYSLILQTESPGWLHAVRCGATTVWERWSAYTEADGFFADTSSFNHYAYGAVVEWFYSRMCGIKPRCDTAGFELFVLEPTPDTRGEGEIPAGQSRITHASASYSSVNGEIHSEWTFVNGRFEYSFTVPHGTVAEVRLICPHDTLTINSLRMTPLELGGRREGGRIVFPLGCGSYRVVLDK